MPASTYLEVIMNTNIKKLITTFASLTAVCALALAAVFISPVSVAHAESRRAGEGGTPQPPIESIGGQPGGGGPFGDGSGL